MKSRTLVIMLVISLVLYLYWQLEALAIAVAAVSVILWMFFYLNVWPNVFTSEDGEDDSDEVEACLKCGGLNISATKHNKHWLKGRAEVMGVYTCQDCGYVGTPIVFKTADEYWEQMAQRRIEDE